MSTRPPPPPNTLSTKGEPPRAEGDSGSPKRQLCYGCALVALVAIVSAWGSVRWNSVSLALSGITFAILAFVGEVRLWRAQKQRSER